MVKSGILVFVVPLVLAACAPQPALVVNAPPRSAPIAEGNSSTPPAAAGAPTAGSPADCAAICQAARSIEAAACVEGELEELGFDMDAKSCNDWEGAASTGMGDPCALFSSCQADEGFTAAHCGTVKATCGL